MLPRSLYGTNRQLLPLHRCSAKGDGLPLLLVAGGDGGGVRSAIGTTTNRQLLPLHRHGSCPRGVAPPRQCCTMALP